MTHVTCMLTAKYRDQLHNPTLDNRVGYGLPFYTVNVCVVHGLFDNLSEDV